MIPDFHLKQHKGGFTMPSDLNISKKLLAKSGGPSRIRQNWRSMTTSGRGTLCATDLLMKQLNFQSTLHGAINGNRPQPIQSAH